MVQDSFATNYRDIRAMLTEKIQNSDAVICAIGFAYGAKPHTHPNLKGPSSEAVTGQGQNREENVKGRENQVREYRKFMY